jgi:hypothetical protein
LLASLRRLSEARGGSDGGCGDTIVVVPEKCPSLEGVVDVRVVAPVSGRFPVVLLRGISC